VSDAFQDAEVMGIRGTTGWTGRAAGTGPRHAWDPTLWPGPPGDQDDVVTSASSGVAAVPGRRAPWASPLVADVGWSPGSESRRIRRQVDRYCRPSGPVVYGSP
jgi:hypothetical protein